MRGSTHLENPLIICRFNRGTEVTQLVKEEAATSRDFSFDEAMAAGREPRAR